MPYRRRSGWSRIAWIVTYRLGAIMLGPSPQPRRTPNPPPSADENEPLEEPPSAKGLRSLTPLAIALVAAFLVFLGLYAAKRESDRTAFATMLTGGDPSKGPALIRQYGCGGCHEIPGVRGASGRVGPSLDHVGARVYLAGMVTNTPANMVQWIANPKEINPRTAMPVTGISDKQARDVAAYFYARR
jgi:cytochrome c2